MDQIFDGLLKVSPDVEPLGLWHGIGWAVLLVGALFLVGALGVLANFTDDGFVATAGWLGTGFWALGHVELRFFRAIAPEHAWGRRFLALAFLAVTVALAYGYSRVTDAVEIGFGIGLLGALVVGVAYWYDGKLEAARYQPPGALGFVLGLVVALGAAYALFRAFSRA